MMKIFPATASGRDVSLPSFSWFFFLLAGGVFLLISFTSYHYWDEYYYLYSVGSFSLPELLSLEPGLGKGLFPQAFFSTKIGFVVFLDLLCSMAGQGYGALLLIQFCFAMVVLAFAWASWLLLRELLGRENAQYAFLVLLFLPVTMYFGYKVLSELFGLFFTVLGCTAYLRLLHSGERKAMAGYFFLALAFLLAGVLCRFTSVVFFGGMVLGLLVLGDRRYPVIRNIVYAAVLSVFLIALTILFYIFFLGLTPAELAGFVGAVTVRTPGLAVKIYAVGMTVQLFFLPLLFVFRRALHPHVRFALVWTLVCSLPFVVVSRYVEPRYFYMALVPMAILVHYGLLQLSGALCGGKRAALCWMTMLAVIVLANRLLFFSLMPYELDQKQYAGLKETTAGLFPAATYLVPWVSDYSFLRFAYPEEDFRLVWSPPGLESHDFFRSRSFVSWAGGSSRYIGSPEAMPDSTGTLLYIGWRYNQPVVRLKEKLQWLPGRYVKNVEKDEKLKNHLALSWIWADPDLDLEKVAEVEPYEAYLIRPRSAGSLEQAPPVSESGRLVHENIGTEERSGER
ncbi:MAG: glycosyltransferase family 39 protein [Desulfobulbaceae bacterium]|nr:glycosyltransferase family 39 protein [Desulfobulbaceae bacterium]